MSTMRVNDINRKMMCLLRRQTLKITLEQNSNHTFLYVLWTKNTMFDNELQHWYLIWVKVLHEVITEEIIFNFRFGGWVELARGGAGRQMSPLERVNRWHEGPEVIMACNYVTFPCGLGFSKYGARLWEGVVQENSTRRKADDARSRYTASLTLHDVSQNSQRSGPETRKKRSNKLQCLEEQLACYKKLVE